MKNSALSKLFSCTARLIVLLSFPLSAFAIGGPPLVTDDPDTPGDGHWEINLATISQRTAYGYAVAAPDADINYGVGEHIQLKADIPWTFAQQPGEGWKSGPGFANYGVKWRFIDEEDAGFSVSTYPQYEHSLSSSSITRGIAPSGGQFFLPLEVSTKMNEFDLDMEVGRNFVQGNPNQWEAGFVIGHECVKDVECLAEIHETLTDRFSGNASSTQTLLNLGLNWKLTESMTLLAAAGREFGKQSNSQIYSLFYLGIQITR
ncbi:hypothetical protein [Solimicrobium silvestre]|uniref:Putative MetA-pathway of phenol degradation n=1 Tax=Solimicrobium silvestre TaxID=2099400 RepID=A0A2S9GZU3_9BURK|nr:hypothetical protein [Solimicrobium silvestre]PRC93220.1 putative MetA-pathway of phenol degradation [Solimicrobium silvestre]